MDAMENPILKPCKVLQIQKSQHSKPAIGVTPGGLISHVTDYMKHFNDAFTQAASVKNVIAD